MKGKTPMSLMVVLSSGGLQIGARLHLSNLGVSSCSILESGLQQIGRGFFWTRRFYP